MSTNYWDYQFLQHLNIENTHIIFEVGARGGEESIQLSNIFSNSKLYTFECNPLTIDICKRNLKDSKNISFFDYGLGDKNEHLPFYSFVKDHNAGSSSFLKRIDFDETQKQTGVVRISKLIDFVKDNTIEYIDLLCMDVQGYELNVLKGAEGFIKNIKYVIMEEPKEIINTRYLPNGVHSKYIGSPSSNEIRTFMRTNGFYEIERVIENEIEDNVMYKNSLFE
jgi:FkbM family methyltransferase